MKFLIAILAVKAVIEMVSKKGKDKNANLQAGTKVEHPAEMELR